MKKWIIVLLLAGLASCSGNTNPPVESKPEAPAAESKPTAPAPVPEPPPAPAASVAPKAEPKTEAKPADKVPSAPASNLKPGLYVHFQTSMGKFTAELNEKEAPVTAANFAGLASGAKEWTDPKTGQKQKKPFYDGLIFHRIIDTFMIQGGDPLANGQGGPGFTIKDEVNDLKHDGAGVLAMARTGNPDSAGSQFYITLAPQPRLDLGAAVPDGSGRRVPYVVFGRVIEGLDVVKTIGVVPTDPDDRPLTPVTIKKITIERIK